MASSISIKYIITRYIRLRKTTLKQVAFDLKRNYKTLSGILNRDAVDAKLLFELANYLNIDLSWMAELFDPNRTITSSDVLYVTRMPGELRTEERPFVLSRMDAHIQESGGNISETRRALLREFGSLFYLLDVLLPPHDTIRVSAMQGKELFYCCLVDPNRVTRGRSTVPCHEGNKMLNMLIENRKAGL